MACGGSPPTKARSARYARAIFSTSSWLAHTENSAEARRCLPTRARIIVDTPRYDGWRSAVTDEDGDADDPPVIVTNDYSFLWCSTPRVSYLLTRLAYDVFCAGHTRIRFNRGESSWFPNAPVRFTDPAVTILEIAEGCFYTNSSLLMRSVKAYADFVREAGSGREGPRQQTQNEGHVRAVAHARLFAALRGLPMSTAFGEVNDGSGVATSPGLQRHAHDRGELRGWARNRRARVPGGAQRLSEAGNRAAADGRALWPGGPKIFGKN